jgi:hypothetical protein
MQNAVTQLSGAVIGLFPRERPSWPVPRPHRTTLPPMSGRDTKSDFPRS